MSIKTAAGSQFPPIAIILALLVVLNLASCGGKESSSNGGVRVGTIAPTATYIEQINPNLPTVQISTPLTSIAYKASADISWTSTNSRSCTSSGGGGTSTSGSFNTGSLTMTTTYVVICIGPGGTGKASLTINVAPSAITGFSDAGGGYVTVISENDLTNGNFITIGGTTNYNNTFTVSNVGPTSFTILSNFFVESGAGYWVRAGGKDANCPEVVTGSPGSIAVLYDASRYNGVAPLSVFFDASDTATIPATPGTSAFHDLEYHYDFDNPGSGNWGDGSATGSSGTGANTSRNIAYGPVAAHVYEEPGVYNVTLKVSDGANTVSQTCVHIAVSDPDIIFANANTVCVAAATSPIPVPGVDVGCPTGATPIRQSNFATILSTYATTGKRVLLKRGDTFDATTTAVLNHEGPGIIGAYGTGASPKVRATNNDSIMNVSSASTPTIKDWRVMDLNFDGLGGTNSYGVFTGGSMSQLLFLRMSIQNTWGGIVLNGATLDWNYTHGHTDSVMFDQMAIVDSTISPIAGYAPGWRIFVSSNRLAILGNALGALSGTAGGSHVIRTPYIGKGVISNNTIARSMINLGIKMHGPTWCDVNSPSGICLSPESCLTQAGYSTDYANECANLGSTYNFATNTHPINTAAATSGYTEGVVVSDNSFIGAGSPYLVVAGPQNAIEDERVRDVIFERNLFKAGDGATQSELVVHGSDITVRNNIFDLSGGRGGVGVEIAPYSSTSPAPVTNNDRVYNNTIFNQDANSESYGVRIRAGVANAIIRNNLAYIPNVTTSGMILDECGAACYVASNNSSNSQVINTSPQFYNTPPVLITDWILQTGSYAFTVVGSPVPVPVWSDFFRNSRPTSGSVHMGATEQ